MTDSDADLVDRYRRGDPAAFAALVRRYQRPLFTFLSRLVGDRERAEDLFQDTFIKVLEALPRYREQGKFGSWLLKIAYRLAVDARRDEMLLAGHTAPDLEAPVGLGPDAVVERSDTWRRIEAAVAELPEKQRRVFLLRQHGEVPFKEIAELTGEPLNTVLSHMNYAVGRLRRAVAGAEGDRRGGRP